MTLWTMSLFLGGCLGLTLFAVLAAAWSWRDAKEWRAVARAEQARAVDADARWRRAYLLLGDLVKAPSPLEAAQAGMLRGPGNPASVDLPADDLDARVDAADADQFGDNHRMAPVDEDLLPL